MTRHHRRGLHTASMGNEGSWGGLGYGITSVPCSLVF